MISFLLGPVTPFNALTKLLIVFCFSVSVLPFSPPTVEKQTRTQHELQTLLKSFALVYFEMSLVTVNLPKAPVPLSCTTRSGILSRLK
jgi:hypothetical protein